MCNPLAFQIIGTVASVMGSMRQGEAAQEQANAQANATNQQAQQALNQGAYQADAAKAQAEKIRKAGRASQGEATAALAASGVKLGKGTALEVKKTITENVEQDALSAILSGKRATDSATEQANILNTSADSTRRAGESAKDASVLSAGSTIVGAGWKMMAKPGGGN